MMIFIGKMRKIVTSPKRKFISRIKNGRNYYAKDKFMLGKLNDYKEGGPE